MSPSVDVIVVGAGPGGLCAALEALRHGLSVQLFDKKVTVGVPVKCAEYFPIREEMEYLLPQATEHMHLFDVPPEAIDNLCKTIRFISPKGKEYEFDFEADILNRTVLEQRLADDVQRLGGVLTLGAPVDLFFDGGAVRVGKTASDSVQAKVVIAADGFPSRIARSAGILEDAYMTPKNVAINYEYLMTDLKVDQKVTEMYVGTRLAPGGYAWIIPKGNGTANVGVGIRTNYSGHKDGKFYLDYFVWESHLSREKLRGGKVGPIIADVLPVDGPLNKTYSGNVMAVGDAAGMVMPTNGGGICTAMITGEIAGKVAADHIEHGTPISVYEQRWKKAMGVEMRSSTKLRRLADHFMGNDRLLNLMLQVLGVKGVKDVLLCRVPKILSPLLFMG